MTKNLLCRCLVVLLVTLWLTCPAPAQVTIVNRPETIGTNSFYIGNRARWRRARC